eukprot:Hpha_TRINITY_DN22446_c0_g1::TRINITY_DN22446_c0_g1_i1::g.95130::m.95130
MAGSLSRRISDSGRSHLDYQKAYSHRIVLTDRGVGGVFRALCPCVGNEDSEEGGCCRCCTGMKLSQLPVEERKVVILCQLSILLAIPTSCLTAALVSDIGEGRTALVNKTDAYLPACMLACILLWLWYCRSGVEWLREIDRVAKAAGPPTTATDDRECRDPWNLPRYPLCPAPTLPGGLRGEVPTAADLVRIIVFHVAGERVEAAAPAAAAAAPSGGLVTLASPMASGSSWTSPPIRPIAPLGGALGSAATLPLTNNSVGEPAAQCALSLTEGVRFASCAGVGSVLAFLQTCVIRFGWTFTQPGSERWQNLWHEDDWANRIVYICSTFAFFFLFLPLFTLLWLILFSYRVQYLRLRALAAVGDDARSARHGLPYLSLVSAPNLLGYAAAREHLLARCTQTNAISAVLDPTLAVMVVLLVACVVTVAIRQLFLCLVVDTLTKTAGSVAVVSFVYIIAVAYYGRRVEQETNRMVRRIAGARWTAQRRWLKLRRLAAPAPESRDAQELCVTTRHSSPTWASDPSGSMSWGPGVEEKDQFALLAIFDGLCGKLTGDAREPNVLGTSLAGVRWGFVLGLLALNTVLAFAVREYQSCSKN